MDLDNSLLKIDIFKECLARTLLISPTKSGKKFWDVNVIGSQIAAEEALKAKVDGFIHMSSSALYGAVDQFPINNQTPIKPIEIYGEAKLAGENIVKKILNNSNMPLIIIRPRTILGDGRLGIFQILFDWIKSNVNVYVIGSGNVKFQFLHAHDLIDAYMLAFDQERSGEYNVGTDRFGTLREALENIISYAGSTSKVRSLPIGLTIGTLKFLDFLRLSPLAPWHYLTYHKEFYFDVSPITNLGWIPKYSNDKMFEESYDWFIDNLNSEILKKGNSPHRKPVREIALKIVKWLS